jgi:hypothetical protein
MTQAELEGAVAALHEAGFSGDEVGVLAHEEVWQEVMEREKGSSMVETAEAGALGGTAVGGLVGLLAGAGALVVPGIGPLLAAGAWASVLGATVAGAGIGAAYGGLMGALVGREVAEEYEEIYRDGLQHGGALLVVRQAAPERIEVARRVMLEANGIGVLVHEP